MSTAPAAISLDQLIDPDAKRTELGAGYRFSFRTGRTPTRIATSCCCPFARHRGKEETAGAKNDRSHFSWRRPAAASADV